ncbi:hypothetical protein SXCC_03185 [Gluconacetobacter sp. SXCC-1]|nr:hypothetical protein SXCC_03185 [Gluconacetobacter sp. SXCC-1]
MAGFFAWGCVYSMRRFALDHAGRGESASLYCRGRPRLIHHMPRCDFM